MSFATITAWTLLRAATIAVLALSIARPLAGALRGLAPRWRRWGWALLLVPALTPPILTGYALARGRFVGGGSTPSAELLYALVLLLKLVPVATLVLHLLPAPLSREGAHAFRMLASQGWIARCRFHLRATGRAPGVALAIVFLLAFADFELAAMWNARTWTVSLFDAHAGGLSLAESLRLVGWPVAVEAIILTALLLDNRTISGPPAALDPAVSERRPSPALLGYLGASVLLVTIVPLAAILVRGATGLPTLIQTFALGSDLLASVAFALGASSAAYALVRWLGRREGTTKKTNRTKTEPPLSSGSPISWFPKSVPAIAGEEASTKGTKAEPPLSCLSCFWWTKKSLPLLCLPGLLGALVLSLLIVTLFQTAILRPAYDTMLPLLLTLTLLLLPLALLLRLLLEAARPRDAAFIAAQLGRHDLLWQLEGRREFLAWAALFCWAYFDFTAASILAPVGFTPVFVRLHNLMHYGENAVLSAMLLAAFATPVAVLLLTAAAARFYARHHGR